MSRAVLKLTLWHQLRAVVCLWRCIEMTDLDTQIDAAHRQAEATEQQARQIEARIIKTGATLPLRQYGTPVSSESLKQNLTTRALICKRDPALASFLGLQDGSYRRDEEQREAMALRAEALKLQTDRLRQVNAASAKYREQQQLAGVNPLTNRRWGL